MQSSSGLACSMPISSARKRSRRGSCSISMSKAARNRVRNSGRERFGRPSSVKMTESICHEKKRQASGNSWYLLATLYGCPSLEDDLAAADLRKCNRTAWNRYIAGALTEVVRTELMRQGKFTQEELTPFSEDEAEIVRKLYVARCLAGEPTRRLPNPIHEINFTNLRFEKPFIAAGYIFPIAANFGGSTFAAPVNFTGTTFLSWARFTNANFASWVNFPDAAFALWADCHFLQRDLFRSNHLQRSDPLHAG
jgi:hypothetical protein